MYKKIFYGWRPDGTFSGGDDPNAVDYVDGENGFLVDRNDPTSKLFVEGGHLKWNNTVITDADSDANAVHYSTTPNQIPDETNAEKITRIVMTSSDDVTSGHIQMNNGGFEINQPLTTNQDINAGTANILGANITQIGNDITSLQTDKLNKGGDTMTGNLLFGTGTNLEMQQRPIILNTTGNATMYANDGADTVITNSSNGIKLEAGGSNNMVLGSDVTVNKQLNVASSLKFSTGNGNKILFASNENGNKIDLQSGWIMGLKAGDQSGAQAAANGRVSLATPNGSGGYTERVGADCNNTLVSNNLKLVNSSFQINDTDTIGVDGTRISYKGNDLALLSDLGTSAHAEFVPSVTIPNVSLGNRFVSACECDGRVAQATVLSTDPTNITVNIYNKDNTTVYDTFTTRLGFSAGYDLGTARPYIAYNNKNRYFMLMCQGYDDGAAAGENYRCRIQAFRMDNNGDFVNGLYNSNIIQLPDSASDNILLDYQISFSHTDSNENDIWYATYSAWNSGASKWEYRVLPIAYEKVFSNLSRATNSYAGNLNVYESDPPTSNGVRIAKGLGETNSGVVLGMVDENRTARIFHIAPYNSTGNVIQETDLDEDPFVYEISKSGSPDLRMTANAPLYYSCGFSTRNKLTTATDSNGQVYDFDFDIIFAHRSASTTDIRHIWSNIKRNTGTSTGVFHTYQPPSNPRYDLYGRYIDSGYKRRIFPASIQSSSNTLFPGVHYNKYLDLWMLYLGSSSTGGVVVFLDPFLRPVELNISGMSKPHNNAQYLMYPGGEGLGVFSNIISCRDTIYNIGSNSLQLFKNLRYA